MKRLLTSLLAVMAATALLWPASAEASWRDGRRTGSKSYSTGYNYNQNRGYDQRHNGYGTRYQQPRTSRYSYHRDCDYGHKTYYQPPRRSTYQRSYSYDYGYQRDYDYGSRYGYDYNYGSRASRGAHYQSPQYSNVVNFGSWGSGWGW